MKENHMRTHGHTITWGTHLGASRAHDARSWYAQLKEWWTAHKAVRREAKLAALPSRWDAKREALTPFRAEAAADMVGAEHAFSTMTTLYGLAQ
jgi:hypothetical protein